MAATAFVMWEVKSVVPSFGQPSDTAWAWGMSFFMITLKWSKALRP